MSAARTAIGVISFVTGAPALAVIGMAFLGFLVLAAVVGALGSRQDSEAKRASVEGVPSSLTPGTQAVQGLHTNGAQQVGAGSFNIGTPDPNRLGSGFSYTAPCAIDWDGDPQAYAPEGSDLPTKDYLRNAGYAGNWWGIQTDTGKPSGTPVIGPGGYYISTTSMKIGGQYLNSSTVPFVALPRGFMGAQLGDYAMVRNNETGQWCWAIFGDVSPKQNKVEVSAATAQALGVGFNKRGVTGNGGSLTLTIYPGSRNTSG